MSVRLASVVSCKLLTRFPRADSLTLLLTQTFRLMLATFHRDSARVEDSVRLGREHLAGGQGLIFPVFFQLFEAVALYKRFASLSAQEKTTLQSAHTLMAQLAADQPQNFRPLQVWLEAERAIATFPPIDAISHLDAAIDAAIAGGMSYIAAYLNEEVAALLTNPKLAAGFVLSS